MEKNYKKLCPFKGWVLENFPFIEADFDALTNYELICKVVEYINKMSSQFNLIIENLDYINNWISTLDLQDEVNNKLDEMAESGQLEEIIAQYLNANALWCFDNVASLKTATNLIDGSFAKTLGYYNPSDGGESTYKIRKVTNNDTVDESFIIALSDETLVAELVYTDEIIIDQLGTKDVEAYDCKSYFDLAFSKGVKIIKLLNKRYRINGTLDIPENTTIEGLTNYTTPSVIAEIGNSNLITANERSITIKNMVLTNSTENSVNGISGELYNNNHYNLKLENLRIIQFLTGINLGGSLWWESSIKNVRCTECNTGLKIINCFDMLVEQYYCDRCVTSGVALYGTNTIKFLCCNFGSIANRCIFVAFGNANEKMNLSFDSCNFEYDTVLTSAVGGFLECSSSYNNAINELLFNNCRFTINGQNADVYSMAFNRGTHATFINCYYFPNSETDNPSSFFNPNKPSKLEIGSIKFINGNSTLPRPAYADANKLCFHDLEKEGVATTGSLNNTQYYNNIQNGTLIYITATNKLFCYSNSAWKEITLT